MTKRIVSGIFILTALGALGVILAGALTSGEQLIVRFLTAVIVAALGLYVISDLRLQADDDAMTARSGRPTRLASMDAPPNSTAAFMATVTKKVEPVSVDPAAEAADNTELLQTAVLADGDQQLVAQRVPPAPQPHQQPAGAKGGRGLRNRRSVSSHPKAPETVFSTGPLGEAIDPPESDELVTENPGLGAFADNSNVTDLFGASEPAAADRAGETDHSTSLDDPTAIEALDGRELEGTELASAELESDESDIVEVATTEDGVADEKAVEEEIASLDIDLPEIESEIAAELEEADLVAAEAEEESAELVGSMAGAPGGVIDVLGTFKSNGSAERNGHSGNNGHSGPFDLASTTAKISFSSDPLGDNVSFGNGVLNGTKGTDSGNNGAEKAAKGTDSPVEAELSEIVTSNENSDGGVDNDGEDADKAEFTYSDELQSPETVWPAPPTPLNGSSTYISFDTPRNADGENSLPAPAVDAELQAAEYADAPLAPIIDLRDIGTQATDTVDMAINVGEVEVIATLIEQGMLSTDGPISDRDVRTMVYVAFTSNELRKLLLAGGTPDGPNYGLDLGPVELFDERIHAPAPKTLYSGIDRPEAQLG